MNEKVKTTFDKQDHLDRVLPYVLDDETLYVVYDCMGVGTGFVGVTDKRLIYFDQDMTGLFKSKKMVSLPYHQIVAVMAADDGGTLGIGKSSSIHLTTTGTFTSSFVFRGADKAMWLYRFIVSKILK